MLRTITTLLLLLPLIAGAQNDTSFQQKLGKNLLTNADIMGEVLELKEHIQDVYVDTNNKALCFSLRDIRNDKALKQKSKYVYYDLTTNRVKWSWRLKVGETFIRNYNGFIVYTGNAGSQKLDPETGEGLWDIKTAIAFADMQSDIAGGYKTLSAFASGYPGSTLQGIRISDGSLVWEREINRTGGWPDVQVLNDSTLLIAASGIHTLNTKTGKGWDYYMVTKSNPNEDHIGGFSSNLLADANHFYLAGSERIACVTRNGKFVWSTVLPRDQASSSIIFIENTTLYMINKGISTDEQMFMGKPFIAAFNKNTGEQLFLKSFDVEKDLIKDYIYRAGEFILLMNERVLKFKTSDLSVKETMINMPGGEFPMKYGNTTTFIPSGDKYISLKQSDSTKLYFRTSNENMYAIAPDLSVSKHLDNSSAYRYYKAYSEYKFIVNEKKTVVLNKDNNPVAELKMSYPVEIINKTLYATKDNRLYVIDLKNVLTD